jgi:hypothetical protein
VDKSIAVDRTTVAFSRLISPDASIITPNRQKIDNDLERALEYGFLLEKPTKRARKLDLVQRMPIVMQDYPSLAWDIHFDPISDFPRADSEDVFLHPYDLRDPVAKEKMPAVDPITNEDIVLNTTIRQFIEKRAARETRPGGLLTTTNALFALRMAIGYDNYTNIPLRMLSHYVKFHDGVDPFVVVRLGNAVSRIAIDSVASVRVMFLMQMALNYESFKTELPDAWWFEVCNFILYDPNTRAARYKELISVLVFSLGCISPIGSGAFPRYNKVSDTDPFPKFPGYTVSPLNCNDQTFYDVFREDIKSDLDSLVQEGLGITAQIFTTLLTALPSRQTVRIYTMMRSVHHQVGFSRGQQHMQHDIQFNTKNSELEAAAGEHPWAPYLRDEYIKFVREAHRRGMFPSEDKWKRTFATSLKSTSAGGAVAKISVRIAEGNRSLGGIRSVTNKPFSLGGARRSEKDEEKWINMNLSDKVSTGLVDPQFNFEINNLLEAYTAENPGSIGTREVTGARKPRGIANVKTQDFNFQRIIGDAMNRQVTATDDSTQINSPNTFIAGKTTGPLMVDAVRSAIATTDCDVVIGDMDYTAYDGTEKKKNMRVYYNEATVTELKHLGYTNTYANVIGGIASVVEALNAEGVGNNSRFVSGRIPTDFYDKYFGNAKLKDIPVQEINDALDKLRIKARIVVIDALRSGELITLALNSLNNRANFRSWLNEFVPTYMRLIRLEIQGDDSETKWRMNPGEFFDIDRYLAMTESFINVSGQNGLIINKKKAVVRLTFSEFLKVTWWLGINCPNNAVLAFASEKVALTESSVTLMRSQRNKFATILSRGGNHDVYSRLFAWMWAFKRSTKSPQSFNTDQTYFQPFAGLWLPISAGGLGMYPNTVHGANVDALIVDKYNHELTDVEKSLMDSAAGIYQVKPPDIRRDLAKMINSNNTDVFPIDPYKAGRQFIRDGLIERRVKAAAAAADSLKEANVIDLSNDRYDRFHINFIDNAIKNNKEIRSIDFLQKNKQVRSQILAAKKEKKGAVDKGFEWVKFFEFKLDEEIDDVLDSTITPFIALDEKIESCYIKYGIISNDSALKLTAPKLLSALRDDPFFPRSIQDDTIINALSSPKASLDTRIQMMILVALGASADTASRVVNKFLDREASFLFFSGLGNVSISDAALSSLDLSRHSHNRIVSGITPNNFNLDRLLKVLGMTKSIIKYITTGACNTIKVIYDGAAEHNALDILLGKKFNPQINKFFTAFPDIEEIRG